MLRLKQLNCTGMFAFGYMPTIQLENGGLVFLGGINKDHNDSSNASGKSSVINAIKEILFGNNDTGKSGPNVVNKHKDWNNGCFGALWLEDNDGVDWRIFCIRKWKGPPPDESIEKDKYQGTDIYLERFDGNQWIDERATSIGNKQFKDTQKKIIEKIVCMSYEQFSAYVMLGQKAKSALVSGTGSDKEKIIQTITDVSIWDNASNIVHAEINKIDTSIIMQKAKIDGLRGAIETFSAPSQDEINKLESDISLLRQQLVLSKLQVNSSRQNIDDKLKEIASLEQEMEGNKQEIEILEAEKRHSLERYQNHEDPEKPEILNELERKISKFEHKLEENKLKLTRFDALGTGICWVCAQEVTKEKLDKERARIKKEDKDSNSGLEKCRDEYNSQFTYYELSIENAKKEALEKYEHEVKLIDEKIAKLQIDKISQAKIELVELQRKDTEILAHDTAIENTIESNEYSLNGLKSRFAEYEASKVLLQKELTEHETQQNNIIHYKWVERNLKKLKLQEYESAVSRLNYLLSEEMRALWGPNLSARFVTSKEKSKGGVKQEFDLLVETPNKQDVPISMYSGGQNKIIALAVFISMIKLCQERGKAVNICGVDEIDTDLDDFNADALVNAITSLKDITSTCIVISHNARLLNTMQFDNKWIMKMENEFSTINFNANLRAVA